MRSRSGRIGRNHAANGPEPTPAWLIPLIPWSGFPSAVGDTASFMTNPLLFNQACSFN